MKASQEKIRSHDSGVSFLRTFRQRHLPGCKALGVGKGVVYLENIERCYVTKILQGGNLRGGGKRKKL